MKKIIYILIFLLTVSISSALSVDSLISISQNLKGIPRVDVLNEIANHYLQTNPKLAIDYANNAIRDANELPYEQGLLNSFIISGKAYAVIEDKDNAVNSFNKGLGIAKDKNNNEQTCYILQYLGSLYKKYAEYNKSIVCFYEIIEILKKYPDNKLAFNTYNYLGNIYHELNDYTKSIEFYFEALENCKQMNDINLLSSLYSSIAYVFQDLKNKDKAFFYAKLALENAEKQKNKETLAQVYNTFGKICFDNKEYEKSKEYYKKELDISVEFHVKSDISLSFLNLGTAHLYCKEYKEAEKMYRIGLDSAKESNDLATIADIYTALGDLSYETQKYQDVLIYVKQAVDIYNNMGADRNGENIRDCYFLLSNSYEKLNQPEKALVYLKKYNEINDSILVSINHAYTVLFDKKNLADREVESLKAKNLMAELNSQKNQFRIFSISLFAILLFISILWIYRLYFKLHTQKKLLEEKNMLIKNVYTSLTTDFKELLLPLTVYISEIGDTYKNINVKTQFNTFIEKYNFLISRIRK